MKQFQSVQACLLAVVCFFGCSGSPEVQMSHVAGEVTLAGSPLENGEILFQPDDGIGRVARFKIVDGQYEGDCVPGLKKVQISSYRELPGVFSDVGNGDTPMREQFLPSKYNSDSTLTAEIPAKKSDPLNFDLTLE